MDVLCRLTGLHFPPLLHHRSPNVSRATLGETEGDKRGKEGWVLKRK